ncbi:MAG: acyl-CoA dehydrogenase family protein [Ardenticatenaceae bacterium]|nr:acyl-CoA dehydrogenase family protein [Ardenticatenaceae bacterium]
MRFEYTTEQQDNQHLYRQFAQNEVAPLARQIDETETFPPELAQKMAELGFLSALVPEEFGGRPLDLISFGLLNEELGNACSSTRSLITVHSMVTFALKRWGRKAQQEKWLPLLASGEKIGAFALSEPNIGSNAGYIETTAVPDKDVLVVNGRKKWITFGQIADLFLLFARQDGKAIALLLEKETPGLTIHPICGMMGTKGAMLAELELKDCRIPSSNMLAGVGFGIMAVAMSALDIGRYSVGWGSVGIGQACLEASLDYTQVREQFGQPLRNFQLIQQMVTNMITHVKAARLLCLQAGSALENQQANATNDILIAKYFASKTAMEVATDAVQIHGANGCSSDYPVQRFLRDAKVMEIIEGSHQMQQIMIAKNAYVA